MRGVRRHISGLCRDDQIRILEQDTDGEIDRLRRVCRRRILLQRQLQNISRLHDRTDRYAPAGEQDSVLPVFEGFEELG